MNATSHLIARDQSDFAPRLRVEAPHGFRLPELAMQGRQVGRQTLEHIAVGHVVADFDGAGEPKGVRAPVALDGYAVEAEKRPAVEPSWVHAFLQDREPPRGKHGAEL